jgi:diadenylate cyclase
VSDKKDSTDVELVLRNTLQEVAPGTALRDGLERILRGRTGGLVVLGYDKSIEQASGGGFVLDVEFSATRLRELAKMDGAVIIDTTTNRIVRAAVQLLPDPSIPTEETGTRHRTADRIAKQTGLPVISVSKSMNIIALYVGSRRYVLEDASAILARANQGIATLERYRHRLDQVSSSLSALEVEDLVTVRDVAVYAQRLEMLRRIRKEIDSYVVELGTDGRLIALQMEELVSGVNTARTLLVRDYIRTEKGKRKPNYDGVLKALDALTSEELLDLLVVSKAMGLATSIDHLDNNVSARGYRLMARIPRVPDLIVDRLVAHFQTLQPLLVASTEELQQVEGIGETRARSIRDGLSRLSEATILERYL